MTRRAARLCRLLAAATLLFAATAASRAEVERRFSFSLSPEYRSDELSWSIAGEADGTNPNILSELDWRDLRAYGLRGGLEYRALRWLALGAEGSYAWITDGANTDSDYDRDDRRGLFSRSTAETDGYLLDAEAVVAVDFFARSARFGAAPLAGLAFYRQHLNDTSGVQRVDKETGETGPFPGLDSEYTAGWTGGFAGLKLWARPSRAISAALEARFYLADYGAEAVWNLRDDFKQNPSFRHDAGGEGWSVRLAAGWEFRPLWTLALYAGWRSFSAKDGTDTTFTKSDGVIKTRLNKSEWDSFQAGLKLTRAF